MSDYPEMCPVCHKADADLCFCSKAAQDAAWNRRAQPAAQALPSITEQQSKWGRLYTAANALVVKMGFIGSMQADSTEMESLKDKLHDLDGGEWMPGLMPPAQPAAPSVCSSCDGTGKISGLPCAWCMQSAAPSVAPEPVAWTLQSELDAAQTTCSAHLWFTNPRNSAWTALFTREQIAAHPPRAPLTEEEFRAAMEAAIPGWEPDENLAMWAGLIKDALEAAHCISAEGEKP